MASSEATRSSGGVEPGTAGNSQLRAAFGCYATGVAIVTIVDAGQAKGLAVNSFTSVSLNPPLVSWCIRKKSGRVLPFLETDGHTISVLSRQHESCCRELAGQGTHSLAGVALEETENGPPAVAHALAVFECRKAAVHNAGDHFLVLSEVLRWSSQDAGAPLIFYKGRYADIADGCTR
jgi:flavin reductase (DIM6/NTAB) family NADH-FMN oxidoreductase RutF